MTEPSTAAKPQYLVLPEIDGLRPDRDLSLPAGPGLFVVAGPNNAGKTRLLKAIEAADLGACLCLRNLTKRLTFEHASLQEIWPSLEHVRVRWPRVLAPYVPGAAYGTVSATIQIEAQTLEWIRTKWPGFDSQWETMLRANIWPHLAGQQGVLVPTNRYVAHEGPLDADPQLEQPHQWPALLDNLTRNPDSKKRAIVRAATDAFKDVTEGLEFKVYGGGSTVQIFIADGGDERSLAVCGDGLRDLTMIVLFAACSPDADLLLDEPGLRLHPTTQRRLLQYLEVIARERAVWIASHDGVFVGAPSVKRRFYVTRNREEHCSYVEELANRESARAALLDLGWAPIDAFLADRVLLCEGPSDRTAFDVIRQLMEVQDPIWGGMATSDLGGQAAVWGRDRKTALRRAQLVKEIAPHAQTVVLLDSDGRTESEREAVGKVLSEAGLPISWLAQIELENYWLHPDVIGAVLDAHFEQARLYQPEFAAKRPTRDEIESALSKHDCRKEKGSEILKAICTPFRIEFCKSIAAKAAVSALPEYDPESALNLMQEIAHAFGARKPFRPPRIRA